LLRILCDGKPVDDEDDGLGAEGVVVASGVRSLISPIRFFEEKCGVEGIPSPWSSSSSEKSRTKRSPRKAMDEFVCMPRC
jgi:hypothetical protein